MKSVVIGVTAKLYNSPDGNRIPGLVLRALDLTGGLRWDIGDKLERAVALEPDD